MVTVRILFREEIAEPGLAWPAGEKISISPPLSRRVCLKGKRVFQILDENKLPDGIFKFFFHIGGGA